VSKQARKGRSVCRHDRTADALVDELFVELTPEGLTLGFNGLVEG
jgi:hypothetical protein